jgi:cytochrome c2
VHYGEVGTCTTCHRGDDRTDREKIAHRELIAARFASFLLPESSRVKEGTELLGRLGCRRCHALGGRGNPVATDLDRVLPSTRPEELAEALRTPVVYMPDFCLVQEDLSRAVTAVLAFSAAAPPREGEVPLLVHFGVESAGGAQDAFTRYCGSCHTVLTATRGGLGTGSIGPNLSGLFTEYYPRRGRDPWSPEALWKWVRNPRSVRPFARMPPVSIPREEFDGLSEVWRGNGDGERGKR